ncbi:hypothetical protein BJ741DRAFT_585256, partial [Chytriomyces cf. hyalinus JEL632]
MKPILQRSHTITAQSLRSNHIFQANAHRSQADAIEQAVLEIQTIAALSPPPPPPHQQQPQHYAPMILSLEGACRSSNGPLSGDPKLYTFFQYAHGNEILLCYHEFDFGLKKEHRIKWHEWREGAKRVNKMTKTYRSRKRVYEHVKEVAEREKCSVTESAARLQPDMDALVGSNKK